MLLEVAIKYDIIWKLYRECNQILKLLHLSLDANQRFIKSSDGKKPISKKSIWSNWLLYALKIIKWLSLLCFTVDHK